MSQTMASWNLGNGVAGGRVSRSWRMSFTIGKDKVRWAFSWTVLYISGHVTRYEVKNSDLWASGPVTRYVYSISLVWSLVCALTALLQRLYIALHKDWHPRFFHVSGCVWLIFKTSVESTVDSFVGITTPLQQWQVHSLIRKVLGYIETPHHALLQCNSTHLLKTIVLMPAPG